LAFPGIRRRAARPDPRRRPAHRRPQHRV